MGTEVEAVGIMKMVVAEVIVEVVVADAIDGNSNGKRSGVSCDFLTFLCGCYSGQSRGISSS